MHYRLYVTNFINVTHAYASGWPLFKTYWLKFRFGITGVKRFFHQKCGDLVHPPNLTRALGKGRMSSFLLVSFFFLLSSGNTRFSHISLHPILTKLGHNDRYLDHYSGTKDGGVRGHHGVTGVKKVICTKKASSPSDYLALTRDLCICSSLTPSTKVMVLKNCQGSFGVTGVKSSFSQKRHQVLQIM